jgi:hypothetical protein
MSDDLEHLFREAQSLMAVPDASAAPAERAAHCLKIARVNKELRRAVMHHVGKFKEQLQSGAPIDRKRVVEVLTGVEMVLQGSFDSTIEMARIAASEIDIKSVERN